MPKQLKTAKRQATVSKKPAPRAVSDKTLQRRVQQTAKDYVSRVK